MTFRFKKRVLVKISSFTVAAFLVLLGFVISKENDLIYLKRRLAHSYQNSLTSLVTGVDNLATALEKSLYATTPVGINNLTDELILQAGSIETALSALPAEKDSSPVLNKFISQVGDYSLYLSKKVIKGESITKKEKENLKTLTKLAKNLSSALDSADYLYNSIDSWKNEIENALDDISTVDGLSSSLTEMEEDLKDSPQLIYDGPFSDHITTKKSVFLAQKAEVSKEKAKSIAANILKIKDSEITFLNEEKGNLPAFIFEFKGGNIAITKKGGLPLYFRKERNIVSSELNYESAVEAGLDFVNSLRLGNFEATYYTTDEGLCVINLALREKGYLFYTDLIKVGVAMDNGEIMFLETGGFLMNHKARKISTPKASLQNAKAKISTELKLIKTDLAVIPTGSGNDIFCYEFYLKNSEDREFLIYLNADTLDEEDFLILLKTDGGTLTK